MRTLWALPLFFAVACTRAEPPVDPAVAQLQAQQESLLKEEEALKERLEEAMGDPGLTDQLREEQALLKSRLDRVRSQLPPAGN